MPELSADDLGAVMRGMQRSAADVHQSLKEGLSSLATISTLAPLCGFFGTVVGIVYSFVGLGTDKSTGMAVVFNGLSNALLPTALGLSVGLMALWFHRYLSGRLATCDCEMEGAGSELLNHITRFRGTWEVGSVHYAAGERPMFGAKSMVEVNQDQKFWFRSMLVTGAALLLTWCVKVVLDFDIESLDLGSATWDAAEYVLFVFSVSCFLAHPLWVRLFHRRRGGLALLAAGMCLCWWAVQMVMVYLP